MIPIFTARQAKMHDQYLIETAHIPGVILMEQAAMATCKTIMESTPPPATVLCVAGGGNNGGDALAVARNLLMLGYDVKIGVTTKTYKGDALLNYTFFENDDRLILLDADTLTDFFAIEADAIIDGIYGIGLNKPITGIQAEIIQQINQHPGLVYAIDIPSGIYADTGQKAAYAVYADHTITFSTPKIGHFLYPGRAYVGKLYIAPIAPMYTSSTNIYHVDELYMPVREANAHKGMFGRLGIIAGAKGISGAAIMATNGAIHSGSGLTTLCSCDYVCDKAQVMLPAATCKTISTEPNFIDETASFDFDTYDALVLGPGIGQDKKTSALVKRVASSAMPKILDADALNNIAQEPTFQFGENTIITPHLGEFSRLTKMPISIIEENSLDIAQNYAKKHKVTLLLKGSTTIVSDGDSTYLVTAGTPAMAKGGSGDVLAGVIGSFLAQGYAPLKAAYMGAYFCGKAAECALCQTGEYAFTPEDTISHLKNVL